MYKKSGSKLKTIALLIRVFGFIVALASAIACWSIAGNISSYNETLKSVMIGAGFEIGIIIIVPVLIGSLILEGFGDLIVLTDDNNECLRKMAGLPAKQTVNVPNTYYNNNAVNPASTAYNNNAVNPTSTAYNNNAVNPASTAGTANAQNSSGTWVCAKCGKVNNSRGDFCVGCGARKPLL